MSGSHRNFNTSEGDPRSNHPRRHQKKWIGQKNQVGFDLHFVPPVLMLGKTCSHKLCVLLIIFLLKLSLSDYLSLLLPLLLPLSFTLLFSWIPPTLFLSLFFSITELFMSLCQYAGLGYEIFYRDHDGLHAFAMPRKPSSLCHMGTQTSRSTKNRANAHTG